MTLFFYNRQTIVFYQRLASQMQHGYVKRVLFVLFPDKIRRTSNANIANPVQLQILLSLLML
jgi:hypothetical protein